jgi:hypothetical protein
MVTDDEARRGLFDGPLQVGLGGLSVVVLGEQLTRLGKQSDPEAPSHNRPKPIPPTRGLLLCLGRWWSDFRFISCGLLAHFWDPTFREIIRASRLEAPMCANDAPSMALAYR